MEPCEVHDWHISKKGNPAMRCLVCGVCGMVKYESYVVKKAQGR